METDVTTWQEKAAKEIQALCQSISVEIEMGDTPPIEVIVAIIDKHFRQHFDAMNKLISETLHRCGGCQKLSNTVLADGDLCPECCFNRIGY